MIVFYVLVLAISLSLVHTCHPGAGHQENGANVGVMSHTGTPPPFEDNDNIFFTSMVTAIVTEEVTTEELTTHHLDSTNIMEDEGHEMNSLHDGETDLQQQISHPDFMLPEKEGILNLDFMPSVVEETSHGEMGNIISEPCEHRQCPPRHLQDRFCRSAFVIQAKVTPTNQTKPNTTYLSYLNDAQADTHQTWSTLNSTAAYDERLQAKDRTVVLTSQSSSHKLILQRILKGSHNWFQGHKMVEIMFDETSAKCHGRQIEENVSYIFTGRVIDDKLFSGQCDWPLQVSSLTGNQRHGLRHQYGRYCTHCQVDTQILPPDPWSTSTYSHVCIYNPTLYYQWGQEDCEGDYSICAKTNTGTCHWLKTSGQMRACVERRDHQGGLPPAPVWVVPDPN